MAIKVVVLVLCCFGSVLCDTPANCTYDDIAGKWTFYEGPRESDSSISCGNFTGATINVLRLDLRFPNLAFDEYGNKGYWTIVYNQGFEVVINYRKYFAFSQYVQDPENGTVATHCNLTMNGWSHDVLGKNWACYYGVRQSGLNEPKVYPAKSLDSSNFRLHQAENYVRLINKLQKSWTARVYPELRTMSYKDLLRRAGGPKSRIFNSPSPRPSRPSLKNFLSLLPEEFDWRNASGIDYVSPVRNQGSCGSCYAFSSLGMLESRLRIMTNNTVQVVFSPQDVVSCSEYSQGCDGGFPYVIAGKYAQDFGVIPEGCYPYEGRDDQCSAKECKRYYVADYKYVGGFFGGCNEELMRLDLIRNGPVTVAMEVYDDFMLYSGGIYHHVNIATGFNPFHLVNHGVLIVGYGISNETGEKFWIVKNSWGPAWGEAGYFRIRRGSNECNIESMAVSAIPIP